jgi:diketogulonate reductase-like aldo/keto reductase
VDFEQIGFDWARAFHSESPFEAVQYGVEEADFRPIDIDCARASGNESVVGSSLKSLLDRGGVTRQDLWITSKPRSRIPVSVISKWI